MSFTGRFPPDFNKAEDLPNADLPHDTPEYIAELEYQLQDEEEDED